MTIYFKSSRATKLFVVVIMLFACQSPDEAPVQDNSLDYPIEPIDFTQVDITDQFWAPRIETNRKVTIPYNFKKCEETGRINNFAIAGGLQEGEFEGIYFNDSDVFKVIEGAAYSLQVHDDPILEAYLDDLIDKIAAAQEDDGYLYTNRTIDPAKASDGAGETRWTDLEHHHELYNVGHMYEAAVAHYQATGNRRLLEVALKNADLVESVFGPGKNMGVPGHQEIEIGLVKLFRVTGDEKYLNLAKFFIDQRGRTEGRQIKEGDYFGKYQQDHIPLVDQREAVGHAVRAGYYYAGATDIAALTGETAYDIALEAIWKDIVHQKIYLTGGIGAEPRHEGFGPAFELPNSTAYTETCAAIALMLWNHRMFLRSGNSKYMDVFEKTLYNGFLAGVSFEGNTFFYPNPLEADGVSKFNQGVCGRSPWFDCSCCPVNVVRILPSLPGYIYAVKDRDIFVNLFVSNAAELIIDGQTVLIRQETSYPWHGKVVITLDSDVSASFRIRRPGWNQNQVLPGDLYSYEDQQVPSVILAVNGDPIEAQMVDGFMVIDRRDWKKDDRIELSLDMPVRKVRSHPLVDANKDKIALERGPLVYCVEQADHSGSVFNMSVPASGDFKYAFDSDLFGGIGTIVGMAYDNDQSSKLMAIPYYAWAHREIGEMRVWLPISSAGD